MHVGDGLLNCHISARQLTVGARIIGDDLLLVIGNALLAESLIKAHVKQVDGQIMLRANGLRLLLPLGEWIHAPAHLVS